MVYMLTCGRAAMYDGVRWTMVTCSAFSEMLGRIVTAVAPEPIRATLAPWMSWSHSSVQT